MTYWNIDKSKMQNIITENTIIPFFFAVYGDIANLPQNHLHMELHKVAAMQLIVQ